MKEHIREIKILHETYSRVHSELDELSKEVTQLLAKQSHLSQELDNTRKTELSIINKIEEQLHRKITQEELIEIIKSDGE